MDKRILKAIPKKGPVIYNQLLNLEKSELIDTLKEGFITFVLQKHPSF